MLTFRTDRYPAEVALTHASLDVSKKVAEAPISSQKMPGKWSMQRGFAHARHTAAAFYFLREQFSRLSIKGPEADRP